MSLDDETIDTLPSERPDFAQYPYRLMTPGPVPVHPEVLKCLSLPAIHHRTPEFQNILNRVLSQLKRVFQTSQHVFAISSTGSGGMEAAIVNTLSPGDRVLVLESGKFGARWADIARQYELSLDIISSPWGQPIEVHDVEKALREKNYKAVLAQACETSTGVMHPIKDIANLLRNESECLFIVDGITAVGTTPMPMDEWGIDVLVAGSQKAFMLPTGMSMIALSYKAWKHNEFAKIPRFYWDLEKEKKANMQGQTRFSSNVPLLRGLDRALTLMLSGGLSQHYIRIQNLAKAIRRGGEILDLKVFASITSPSLTAFALPENVNGQSIRSHLEEKYNITVAGGQDQLKGKIIRIGHMGAITDEDAIETMRFLGKSLNDLYPTFFTADLADRAAEVVAEELDVSSRS